MNTYINPLFIKTFRKAYELKNFTLTAVQLGMTQSGVSQHIAQIEECLGTSLFERVGRKVLPTPAADKLYVTGGNWLAQMQDFIEMVQSEEQVLKGKVSLGTPASFGVYLLPYLVEWQKNHPEIVLDIHYGPRAPKLKALGNGQMDLAITGDPFDQTYFMNEEIFEQEFVLVSHPDLKVKIQNWEDFLKIPIVDYAGSASIYQKWIKAHFPKSKYEPDKLLIKANTNSMDSMCYLLEQQVGFTIFPKEPLLHLIKAKRLKVHSTPKTVTNTLYLVQRKGQKLSRRIDAVKKIICDLQKR
jgi:DNA-binding transcriptional LysR family regulator